MYIGRMTSFINTVGKKYRKNVSSVKLNCTSVKANLDPDPLKSMPYTAFLASRSLAIYVGKIIWTTIISNTFT